jgi:aminodeoxyfutalosine deaminase
MGHSDLASFIAGLPKAELHVHQVGSASPRIVAELAARYPESPVPKTPELVGDYFRFSDFAHFVTVYLSVVDLVRTPEDVRMLTYEIAREMAGQRIRYAELTCSPYTSVLAGVAAPAYCEAIEDARQAARRDLGIVLQWCFDIPGEFGIPAAQETLRIATEVAPDGLVSFGLGGPEIGVPRPQFKQFFDRARAAGLRSVPHAGETTGPQTIWDALVELGAERIGHGTSAPSDPRLLEHLASAGIPLEVCPTSNIATGAVAEISEHPIISMHEAGVTVTVNSDDPPMFNTTLNHEYEVAAELLRLDAAGVAELARTAVRASFAGDELKTELLAEIDDYLSLAAS